MTVWCIYLFIYESLFFIWITISLFTYKFSFKEEEKKMEMKIDESVGSR